MPPFPPKKWTIMIYMAGAKQSSFVRDALFEMKRIGSNQDVNVLAQFDTGSDGIATKRYYLTRLEGARQLYKTVKDIDLQSLETQLKGLTIQASDGEFGLFRAIERLEVKVGEGTRTLRSVFDEVLDETARRSLQKTLRETDPKQLVQSAVLLIIYLLGALLESDNVSHIPNKDEARKERKREDENSIGQTDTGDPRDLQKFIHWGIYNYPAERQMIIIMGHGDGTSVAWDTTEDFEPSELTARELGAVLTPPDSFKEFFGRRENNDYEKDKFDIIGFNACNMGTVEVYHRLSEKAELGIASEAGTPLENWPYRRIIGMLQQHSNLKNEQVASLIVEEFVDRYSDFETTCLMDNNATQCNIDIAACKLSKVQGLVDEITRLSKLLSYGLDDPKFVRSVFEARRRSESYYGAEFQYVDLADFCDQLLKQLAKPDNADIKNGQIPQIKESCKKIIDQVKETVIRSEPFVLAPRSNGLSIYFPMDGARVSPKYKDRLEFKETPSWRTFLEKYIKLSEMKPEDLDKYLTLRKSAK